MIHHLGIDVCEKAAGDFRAFLYWADSESNEKYEIRGYSTESFGDAANNAQQKFVTDREAYSEYCGPWDYTREGNPHHD